MIIKELLKSGKTIFSFEFFPPKTPAGWENLFNTIRKLIPLAPGYVSVTYGAGGTTRDRTHELVTRIKRETGIEVVAHLTCAGSSREEIRDILSRYSECGITNILALKGDPPQSGETPRPDDFAHASDLVAFTRSLFPETGIGVAGFPEGHPATMNRLKEIDYLKEKVDAGADYIVTQLFFDNRDFFDFRERCAIAGINIPIIAGIMPITSRKSMIRMADLAARCRYPAGLLKALDRAGTDDQVEKVGSHWATRQIMELLEQNVPGIHLYTLNHSDASIDICRNLGIDNYDQV